VIYGDLNFAAPGEIVERITHRPLDAYCAEHIFVPLGMRDAGYFALPLVRPALDWYANNRGVESERRNSALAGCLGAKPRCKSDITSKSCRLYDSACAAPTGASKAGRARTSGKSAAAHIRAKVS
jgi:CubicO group peptidase (beta-lactamase class C family)